MDNLLFIANYEAILRERKIKKGDFYAACSITDAAVSQWRKNKNNPAMTTIKRIADFLDVPVYVLMGEETKKEPATNGDELDETTKELRDIWESADEDERKALLEMARLIKKRRG